MKDMQHDKGAFSVSNEVADALERLAIALAAERMSAHMVLRHPGDDAEEELTLGLDKTSGRSHRLRARPSTGEGSHLGWDEA